MLCSEEDFRDSVYRRDYRVNAEKTKKKEERSFFSILINFIASLRLTIPLLILLAALSVIGTVITQNATEAEYLRLYSKETYYILKGLGLFNMYHSPWFKLLLVLLAINLIFCSWKRLPGVWQQVRKHKSNYARLGTYLTHLSVLVILVGGLIGAVWGFKGYVEIPEGETVEAFYLNNPQQEVKPLGFQVRCDAFRVEFYPDGAPREYVSTLTVLDGGEVVIDHAPLRVNHPLSYEGLTLYQASYGISALPMVEVRKKGAGNASHTLQLEQGRAQPIPGTQVQIGFMQYRDNVHGLGEAILLVLFPPDAPPEGFWLFREKDLQVEDLTFSFKDIEKRYYTGIQVAHDPGVPVVWVGCALLVIGMVGTFTLRKPSKGTSLQDT
jgi:cytochrome c biogenesis protein